jgi:hypothetical protein
MLIIFAKHPPANLHEYLRVEQSDSEFHLLEEVRRLLKEGIPRIHVPRCPNEVLLQLQFDLDENKYCVAMRDAGDKFGEVFLERDSRASAQPAPGPS